MQVVGPFFIADGGVVLGGAIGFAAGYLVGWLLDEGASNPSRGETQSTERLKFGAIGAGIACLIRRLAGCSGARSAGVLALGGFQQLCKFRRDIALQLRGRRGSVISPNASLDSTHQLSQAGKCTFGFRSTQIFTRDIRRRFRAQRREVVQALEQSPVNLWREQ